MSNALATAREGVWFGQAESCELQEVHIEWQWQMFKVKTNRQSIAINSATRKRQKKDKKRSADIIRSRCQNCFILQTI